MMTLEATGPMTHESKDDIELKQAALTTQWVKKGQETSNCWTIDLNDLQGANVEGSLLDFLKRSRPEWTWTPPDDVWCLVLFVRNWYWDRLGQQKELDTRCYSGLVLKQAETKNGEYERIGSFHNQKCSWLERGARETVRIV
jgi:hypothetical protein